MKGVGPATAIKLLIQHGTIEKVVEAMPDKIPENFRYQAARDFFRECEAVDTSNLEFKWEEPNFEGLSKFLIEECSFQKERVDRYMERLKLAKGRTKQRPLDSFFGPAKVVIKDSEKFDPNKKKPAAKAAAKAGDKRKAAGPAGGQGASKRAK